jgi:uncharacterized protein
MKSLKKYCLFILLGSVLVLSFNACKKDKKEDEITPEDSFDKSGMLANIGDNIIIPAYASLKISVDSLQLSSNMFVANPTLATLTDLQAKFIRAYKNYEWSSAFEFGPAEIEYFRSAFNIFPCDTLEINNKIANANYTFTAASDLDAKGLPAIDYLLYGNNQDYNAVLARYTTDVNASNSKTYLTALINELKTKCDAVNNGWSASGGNYISTFKNSTGSDVGGSIGMLVNQLNFDLELLKNAQVGIPLGKKTLGTPQPSKVEALYSAQSLILVTEHLKSIENIYLGKNISNSNGLGFDDYLIHLGTQYGSGSLNDAINNKFSLAKNKLSLIPGTLSDAVINNPSVVDAAYVELQQLVILLKVDMPSALGVSITYIDADGD